MHLSVETFDERDALLFVELKPLLRLRCAIRVVALQVASSASVPSNGEVEGPPRSARSSAAGAQSLQRPRRVTTSRSRSPPTIVRRPPRPMLERIQDSKATKCKRNKANYGPRLRGPLNWRAIHETEDRP